MDDAHLLRNTEEVEDEAGMCDKYKGQLCI